MWEDERKNDVVWSPKSVRLLCLYVFVHFALDGFVYIYIYSYMCNIFFSLNQLVSVYGVCARIERWNHINNKSNWRYIQSVLVRLAIMQCKHKEEEGKKSCWR